MVHKGHIYPDFEYHVVFLKSKNKPGQPYVSVTLDLKVGSELRYTLACPEMEFELMSQHDICKFTINCDIAL